MSDVSPQSESILGIVGAIEKSSTLLPEFQRDFKWQLELTYDLFDSLAKGIFIGTIIYGKPSFAISCRELDDRPRNGKGSRRKLSIRHIGEAEARRLSSSDSFRLVLDGQQRITAIFRAITGKDTVYLVLKKHGQLCAQASSGLEDLMDYFSGSQREDRISIRVSDVYDYERESVRESTMIERLEQSLFFKRHEHTWSIEAKDAVVDLYLRACQQLRDLLKREKLVSYYLLDMSLDKFCLFFERSNSKGMQLNFTDILAAKLYSGFNLRESIEKFEDDNPSIQPNRELIIRAISYFSSSGREIDKGYILKNLRPEHFNKYWDEVCNLYVRVLGFLYENRFMLSQKWLPSENMVLPLIVFFRELEVNGNLLEEDQLNFIRLWYWASVFANRYTGASNEVMLEDARVLREVARMEFPKDNSYFRKLRSRLTDAEDILGFQKRASSVYKGLLNIINFDSDQGLLDWANTSRVSLNHDKLQDHHIFPKAYLKNRYVDQPEILDMVDTVANRALIPKLTNLKIGAKPPSRYLGELLDKNPDLRISLRSHKIDDEIILDEAFDDLFEDFIRYRALSVFDVVKRVAIDPLSRYLPLREPIVGRSSDRTKKTNIGGAIRPWRDSVPNSSNGVEIPVTAEYSARGSGDRYTFDATLCLDTSQPNRSRIRVNGQLLKPSPAGLACIHTVNSSKRAVNGWTFWTLRDPRNSEKRFISDLRADESLINACIAHYG